MICIKNILFIVSASIIFKDDILAESAVDSDILRTEAIIRNTTNKLFSALKFKKDPRLNQYLIINKFFASLTLKDHDSLNEIAKISRANTSNYNASEIFITAINELLDDDSQIESNEINNDVETAKHDDLVVEIIQTFLKRLKEAKELYDINSYGKINDNVLNLIKGQSVDNTTSSRGHDENIFENDRLFEDIDFWKPSGRRVYKGERTKIKHFPFMASIQMFNNFQCGGSIIKSDLVITASSCLQLAWNNRFYRENPAFLSVRVGSSFYGGGGEVIPVLEVYFHPEYNPKNLRNNICVVRLTRRINFSWRSRRRVRKIDIDRKPYNLPFNTPGITILGWGAKGQSNIVRDPWQNILSYAILNIYPLKDCQDVYSKEYVTHKNFCAGFMSKGGGACNRDIGGPGIDDGILMGVVSFGSPVCGAAEAPTVFTKLGYYSQWIDSIIELDVPYSKKRTTLKPSKTPFTVPLRHTPPTTTTFKIPPLMGGKMTPVPINDFVDVLRMFDEDLFSEFLKTMFDSKELSEYQDVFKEIKQKVGSEGAKPENHERQIVEDEPYEVTSPYIEFEPARTTQLIEYDAEYVETTTQSERSDKYTVLDEISSESEFVKDDIADLLSNIDLKKIIQEESIAAKKENEAKGITESIFFEETEPPQDVKKKNESVLTLLYLSDENRDVSNQETDAEEVLVGGEKGLSISTDTFQDLTRSKGKNLDLYKLPEKELYDILSEVIDEEMQNKQFDER
ncbi:uncharacterized protein [Epargyreus clarus]|uniref:uncharacterized protein n=1 Tax=Epargyreus clarus TaxID=520877 RepID=UPI003C308FEB